MEGLPVGREKRRIGTSVPDVFGFEVVVVVDSGRQVVGMISEVTGLSVEAVDGG